MVTNPSSLQSGLGTGQRAGRSAQTLLLLEPALGCSMGVPDSSRPGFPGVRAPDQGEERPGLRKHKPVSGDPSCPHPQTQCEETALQTGGGGAGSPSAQERTHDSPGSWPGGSRDSTRPSAVTNRSLRRADPSYQEGEEIRFLTPHPCPPGFQGAQGVGDFPGAGVPGPPEEALPSPVPSRAPATGRVWRSGLKPTGYLRSNPACLLSKSLGW